MPIPLSESGDANKWCRIIHATIELDMPSIRSYILNKLAEDKAFVSAHLIELLTWIQDKDQEQEKLLIESIQILVYRRSPLARKEAGIYQSIKSGPESNILQIAVDSMCAVCRVNYAASLKQHANLEFVKYLGLTDGKKVSGPKCPNSVPVKSCPKSRNV
ncbi:hypothetical protein B0J17DRAFT_709594 [Rhizoctonia solani]|nr:hypothetical protein B0J17DRAFT_709594 [Rhizoctonia solani]